MIRQKLAYMCFALASLFVGLGKLVRSKNCSIVVVPLTLPSWFIMHEHLIKQELLGGKLVGFTWHSYTLPDRWCRDMKKFTPLGKKS